MIIVEGADNVGKSTLIRRLVELDPNLRLLKRERFRPERGETIGTSYLNLLFPTPGLPIERHAYSILDRFLVSECIYGKLFRGGCRMSAREHILIKQMLALYKPLIIWCDAPDVAITDSWTSREQLYNDPILIANAYRAHVDELFHPFAVERYDWTSSYDGHLANLVRLHTLQNADHESYLSHFNPCDSL